MYEIIIDINKILLNVFDHVLHIEEYSLKKGVFCDVSVKEVHTIEAIGLHCQKTMTEVANLLKITIGTLTVAVNNLVKKGYVKRQRQEDDRRVVKISLTNKGKLLYRIHHSFHSDMLKEIFVDYTYEEKEIFLNSLKKIETYLKNEKL